MEQTPETTQAITFNLSVEQAKTVLKGLRLKIDDDVSDLEDVVNLGDLIPMLDSIKSDALLGVQIATAIRRSETVATERKATDD